MEHPMIAPFGNLVYAKRRNHRLFNSKIRRLIVKSVNSYLIACKLWCNRSILIDIWFCIAGHSNLNDLKITGSPNGQRASTKQQLISKLCGNSKSIACSQSIIACFFLVCPIVNQFDRSTIQYILYCISNELPLFPIETTCQIWFPIGQT